MYDIRRVATSVSDGISTRYYDRTNTGIKSGFKLVLPISLKLVIKRSHSSTVDDFSLAGHPVSKNLKVKA